MICNKDIPVIDLVDANGRNILFGTDQTRYVVPIYQRSFAWGGANGRTKPDEIVQLIDDVLSSSSERNYYLGSLVVSKCQQGEYDYEVIDGQQRLTALYLIFACLGFKLNPGSLGYACREDSAKVLGQLANLELDACFARQDCDKRQEKEPSPLLVGLRTIRDHFKSQGNHDEEDYKRRLREAFKRVKLFRIEVPEGTDLNHYFEIMNTRGEQLEQQDIVKADLLSMLVDDRQRSAFAMAWDACSDMDGYVQMHFPGEHAKGAASPREVVFGEEWTAAPGIDGLKGLGKITATPTCSFDELVDGEVDDKDVVEEDGAYRNARFEGVVDYPHFLLHVLKVFNRVKAVGAELPEQTDPANLREEFGKVFPRESPNVQRVLDFAQCLLTCRYYFDKYVIKREFYGENDDGAWSLKELAQSKARGKASAYYRDTVNGGEAFAQHRRLLMIEACLRVSYTNPKSMHWITNLLCWLHENGEGRMADLLKYAEDMARGKVRSFLKDGDYNQGVRTPNVVLNYLDYLLWRNAQVLHQIPAYAGLFEQPFAFEFRNSVEHWYPRHPDEGAEGCPEWSAADSEHGVVDRFGNLALLQSNINSHFSNQPPRGKCGYDGLIKKGSLKLRIMAALTEGADNEHWRTSACGKHEEEMLNILREDCKAHPEAMEMPWGPGDL